MTIYIDVTEVVGIGGGTGVQRVVREIAGRSEPAGARYGVDIIPVVATGTGMHRLASPYGEVLGLHGGGSARQSARNSAGAQLKSWLRKHSPRLFGAAQRFAFRRRMRAIVEHRCDSRPIKPGAEDCLVLLDSFWNGSTILDAAFAAHRRGTRIMLVIYDLFPIRAPQQVDPHVAHAFPRLLHRAVAMAGGVLAISREVSRDAVEYFGAALPPAHVRHFYLGQDFSPSTTAADPDALPAGFRSDAAARYLMIGTIEPRRGHAYVLDAFDRLWTDGGEQRLMLLGRTGWQMEDFVARCRAHPRFGTHLFVIGDASDAILAAAIDATDAVIMASYFEGFGLPLVEALLTGTPVLASDISIFQEIAGDTPLFFRCGDAAALAEAVTAFEVDPDLWRRRAVAFRWLDWDEAAGLFYDTVLDLSSQDVADTAA